MKNLGFRSALFVKTGVVLALVATQSACAVLVSSAMNASVNEEEIRTKTAAYFSVAPDKLEISDIVKGTIDTGYKTTVNGQVYNCQIYYGAVDCKKPGG